MLMRFALRFILTTVAVPLCAYVLPGMQMADPVAALVVGACLATVSAVLRPILHLVTAPLGIVTLGLFYLIPDTALLYYSTTILPRAVTFTSWEWALGCAVIINLLRTLAGRVNRT